MLTLGLVNNASLIGTISALFDVGSFFGAILAFLIGGILGRKRALLLGTTIMIVGVCLQTAASSIAVMIAGRIVTGLGNGMNCATAPIWQSETSRAEMRGKLVIIQLIMCVVGFSIVNWLNYGLAFVPGSFGWRFPLAFQLVFLFIILATAPWLPESPRWLIAKGRYDESKKILADLAAVDYDDPFVAREFQRIEAAIMFERENQLSILDILLRRSRSHTGTCTVRRLILGMATLAMKELTGINVTSYYLPTLLTASVGLSNTMARLITSLNTISYLIASLFGIPLIEYWGRRKMMIVGAAGQAFSHIMITICIRIKELPSNTHPTEAAKASIAFFFIYYVFFGIGWQGIPFLYPAEINSLAMRTKGTALSTATSWAFNYMGKCNHRLPLRELMINQVVQITPIGINSIQWRFYIIWAICNVVFIPIIYLFYPETANRSLEDIDSFFRENHDPLIFRYKEAVSVQRPARYELEDQRELTAKQSEKVEVTHCD